jgi:UDP-N-acetylmuramoylalanine--D-glutamate ligase
LSVEEFDQRLRRWKHQSKDGSVYFNGSNETCQSIANMSKGKKHSFSAGDAPVAIEETKLKGTHNLGNIAAAFKVATEQCGVPKDVAIDAIKKFTPLKHRLELIAIKDGIEWINDSISTTPESAIAALDALGDRVQTIILGGQDRGYDFSKLGKRLKDSSVKVAILLPDSGKTIGEAIRAAKADIELIPAATIVDRKNP